jgi:hypothetical protein
MLGYHFHPTTADVGIRSNMILDLGFDKAVEAYGYWEESYYDWAACLGTGEDWPILCGKLDPSRLGGIQLMEQYFGRITTSECASLALAPVGQAFRRKYIIPRGQDIVCWTSGPHASYANIQKMWRNDWSPAAEPCIYVYKMMGLHFAKATSSSFVESTHPPSLLAQKLAILPRDVPHIFMIHLVGPTDPLRELLAYIHGTFIPANPGSQFICSADIPRLVIPNPRRFTMPELEEAARCFLRGFAGRPPAFVEYGEGRYMSDASLFKALQAALQAYLTAMVESGSRPRVPPRRLWPARVEVPDFIYPPLGYKEDEVEDYRVGDAISLSTFAAAVMELPEEDDRVPYQVAITVPEQPGIVVYANAAEFLTGMCELFLRLRGPAPSQMSDSMHMIPGYLIPISNLPLEDARAATTEPGPLTRLDWYNDLQLWTLEPLRLRTSLPSPGPAVPPASR